MSQDIPNRDLDKLLDEAILKMMKEMVLNNLLLGLYNGWNKNAPPTFRGFKCGKCRVAIVRAWHIWVDTAGGVKVEVHLCRSCGRMYGYRQPGGSPGANRHPTQSPHLHPGSGQQVSAQL